MDARGVTRAHRVERRLRQYVAIDDGLPGQRRSAPGHADRGARLGVEQLRDRYRLQRGEVARSHVELVEDASGDARGAVAVGYPCAGAALRDRLAEEPACRGEGEE